MKVSCWSVACVCWLGLLAWSLPQSALGAPFPEEGEALIKQAVLRASDCIVRIETVGGLDLIDGELAGTGPTTGVIVSADGYIITSAYNFAANPASILVTLPGTDQRLPAEIVARDHLKQLTLLKVDAEGLLPAQPVPADEVRVGQWAVALGRTYAPSLPNVSLGLVSALGRVNGKAIQTDAKVSPANYGGPLIDLRGRVLGILVPLSPQGKGLTDGMNWYDSGIGFAIPLEDIFSKLETLQSGNDLHPGLMGVSFPGTAAFLAEPTVLEVRPNSPAAEAGFQKQDRVIRAEGKATPSVAALRQVLGRIYAGDTVSLTVLRDEEEVTLEVTLAEKLEAFHFGWLGVLPDRDASEPSVNQADSVENPGIELRYVFPDSPAESAGLQKRDRLLEIDGRAVTSLAELREILLVRKPDEELQVTFLRDTQPQEAAVRLGSLPQEIPDDVPRPTLTKPAEAGPQLTEKVGDVTLQVEGHERTARLYVPEDYNPAEAYGCLLWLSSNGEPIPAGQLAEWKRLCRTRGWLLLMPTAENLQPWSSDDTVWLMETLAETRRRYPLDAEKICLVTAGPTPTYLWQLALEHREHFRGILAFSVPARIRVPPNEPGRRFQTLLSDPSEQGKKVAPRLSELLTNEGYPITSADITVSTLSREDLDTLGHWLELFSSQ